MKKFLCILLTICLLGAMLSACGKKQNDNSEGNENTTADYNKVADRVYVYFGEYNDSLISISLNQNGSLLMITSHDLEYAFLPESQWGDFASFEYDTTGKMIKATVLGETSEISAYDENGRPTKIGTGENSRVLFEYNGNNTAFHIEADVIMTIDELGRCVKLEELDTGDSYTLEFEGNIGTWVYNNAGEKADVYTLVYENNRMAKCSEFRYDGTCSWTFETKYGATGLPTEHSWIEDPDDPEYREGVRWVAEYNVNENVTKISGYDITNQANEKLLELVFTYDESGNLVKKEELDRDGTVISTQTYEYNENGKVLKEEFAYADGSENEICVYEYREDGTLAKKSIVSNNENERLEELYEYYEDGRSLSKHTAVFFDKNSNKQHRYETQYDRDGNMIS